MQTLSDKSGNTVAYLYNNVILLPDYTVAGVLLTHCVFISNGSVKGKFFHGYLYNIRGEIVATQGLSKPIETTAETAARVMLDAWKILSLTREHLCPWVVATEKWSSVALREFLAIDTVPKELAVH